MNNVSRCVKVCAYGELPQPIDQVGQRINQR